MALPTSGNSISFGQINDELDNTTTDTLDLENARTWTQQSDLDTEFKNCDDRTPRSTC